MKINLQSLELVLIIRMNNILIVEIICIATLLFLGAGSVYLSLICIWSLA